MSVLPLIESVLAVLLVLLVVAQNKGGGLGSALGGDSNEFAAVRGANNLMHTMTIIVALAFFATLVLDVFFL